MATRVLLPKEQVFSNIGVVGSGYRLFFYERGTTTKKNTYSNEELTIANTNPVVADPAGRFGDIWISDSSLYKCILAPAGTDDPPTNPIWTADPLNLNNAGLITLDPLPTAYWGTTTGSSTAYELNIPNLLVPIPSYSNKQTFFVDFHIACGASPTLAINGLSALNLKKYTGTGTKTALATGDVQVGRYVCINDGVDIVVLNIPIQATESIAGVAEIATEAEAAAATDDSKIITPLKQRVIQAVNFQTGAYATGTTVIPFDDSIPQNTEGNEYMTLAITPKSATNRLIIQAIINFNHSAAGEATMALFQDSTANALAGVSGSILPGSQEQQLILTHSMIAGTTSATTFKIRAGSKNAGTFYFNGDSGGRKLGGVMASSITILELKP